MALCGLEKERSASGSQRQRRSDRAIEHIVDQKCASKTCPGAAQIKINPEFCKGLRQVCQNFVGEELSPELKHAYTINNDLCTQVRGM